MGEKTLNHYVSNISSIYNIQSLKILSIKKTNITTSKIGQEPK